MNGNGPTHGGLQVVFTPVNEGSSPCSRGLKCEAPFAWVPYPTQNYITLFWYETKPKCSYFSKLLPGIEILCL
jgi:hypothetical protein